MFTGIIETVGHVEEILIEGSNKHFCVASSLSDALKVDQSVAHNGVCLTTTKIAGQKHWVTAVRETLERSTLNELKPGDPVNLERCMLNNGRFDGHIVQGHVDQTGICTAIEAQDGSWLFHFTYDPKDQNMTVEKGSITVNGVSLTCFHSRVDGFAVAIIPYTFRHTTFHALKIGDTVNLEFDVIGKYVRRIMAERT